MDLTKLKELLDNEYNWPADYTFKFVGNDSHREELMLRVGQRPSKEQPSKSGKYISYTFTVNCKDSDQVINIYKLVGEISGIISL